MFSNRFLLFDDDVCAGVFQAQDKDVKTSVLLSPEGDFVQISHGNEDLVSHLTRYIPSRFYNEVKELLEFRNTFAKHAFMSERFCSVTSACAN